MQKQIGGCSHFWPIFLALQVLTDNLAKILFPTLNSLNKNEYTVKDSFQFVEEICEQGATLFMGI